MTALDHYQCAFLRLALEK